MHPNICSFAKGVLEVMMSEDYEGILLTTCCDSIRRLYDVLKETYPDKFIYLLDVPRITKDAGITLYEKRIREMIAAYEAFSGKKFDEKKFGDLIQSRIHGDVSTSNAPAHDSEIRKNSFSLLKESSSDKSISDDVSFSGSTDLKIIALLRRDLAT